MKRVIWVAFAIAALTTGTADVAPHLGSSSTQERIVILGDSVAHGAGDERGLGISGWLSRYRHTSVVNLGINGARTANVRALLGDRFAQAQVRAASLIVLSIGGNDLYGDSIARVVARIFPNIKQELTILRMERVVASLRRLNPTARIEILGLYNPYHHSTLAAWLDEQVNRWDARLIWSFADSPRVNVIRIADLLLRDERISPIDHFHPASAGYALIASRILSSM